MNERIRELADKVANIMPAGVYNIKYDSGKRGVEFTEDALEKFAELIVRECARLADEPTSQPCNSYGEKIRQHFGVRE